MLVLLVVVVSCLALTPTPLEGSASALDKLGHLIAFTALAFAAYLGFPASRGMRTAVLFLLLAYGGLIEVLQLFVPGRTSEWGDLLADGIGIALGAGSAAFVLRPSASASWWRAFLPAPIAADRRERLRVVLGATLGILVTALLCRMAAGSADASWPWLVAPLGASAVLVFAVPASPLAQPWAVVGGNTLSALVGIACVHWVGRPELAAALAVGLAIALMFALRCLHPPGGASALLVALNGVVDPRFALDPVLLNSVLLVLVGMAYNHATRRSYPHAQLSPASTARDAEADAVDADLDAVLARYNQVLDISRDDLKALLADTQLAAYQRKLANLRCSDIMSRKLVTVGRQTPLQQAWALFREHRIKALPVVDAGGGIIGIVTPADFMRAAEREAGAGFDTRLRMLRAWADDHSTAQHQAVGSIMTRQVRVASMHRFLSELIPLFGSTGHHHIPIVDADDRLVGIVTQSDVVAALAQPRLTSPGPA